MTRGLEFALIALNAAGLALLATLVWRADRSRAAETGRLRDEVDHLARSIATKSTLPPPETKAVFIPTTRRDRPEAAVAKKPVLIAVPDLAPPPPESVEPPADLVRRFGAIWDLADSGAATEAIARATGQPIGQVELILGLRRARPGEGRG